MNNFTPKGPFENEVPKPVKKTTEPPFTPESSEPSYVASDGKKAFEAAPAKNAYIDAVDGKVHDVDFAAEGGEGRTDGKTRDKNGIVIQVGDLVVIAAVVKSVSEFEIAVETADAAFENNKMTVTLPSAHVQKA